MRVVKSLHARQRTALLLIVAALSSFSYGSTLYVDDDVVGSSDGTSWTDAFAFLQDALAAASASAEPVEIRVAQGVYRPDLGAGRAPGDPKASFALINGVALRGGFSGPGTPDPNARDAGAYESVLSGLIGAEGISRPHSLFVVTATQVDPTAVLDGFTISAGGGGMCNDHSSPTIVDCTFCDNSVFYLTQAASGSGMVSKASSPALRGCTFSRNAAIHGAGMYNEASQPTLTDCLFSENSARFVGGGMENTASDPTLLNCIFTGNAADHYGGAMSNTDSVPILVHCTLTANTAEGKGGAMYNVRSSPLLTNCILWSNAAASGPAIFDDTDSSASATYSNIQDGWPGTGNLNVDPLFADPDSGDLHLRSQAGRWESASQSWVPDDVTSPCIDAGDPLGALAFEPYPNSGVVNLGAYGGTAQASMSPSGVHGAYSSGTGEPNDPYRICTAEHLNAIGAHPGDWSKHFLLVADIDMTQSIDGAFNRAGTDKNHAFTGVFDGGGHTISHLAIVCDADNGAGLFGYVCGADAEIRDVELIDPRVEAPATDGAAALVGYLDGAIVVDCFARGGVVSGDRAVGGLVGFNQRGTVARSGSTATVSGNENVGGLAGDNDGTITACYVSGAVTGRAKAAGGLVGQNSGSLQDCYSRTAVAGSDRVGGLVGKNAGALTCCYCTGSVTGDRFLGGLLGSSVGGATAQVAACLWDIQSSGLSNMCGLGDGGDGACGKTTAEMQASDTFRAAGWDLAGETDNGTDDIWWIPEGQDYPRLWWERAP